MICAASAGGGAILFENRFFYTMLFKNELCVNVCGALVFFVNFK